MRAFIFPGQGSQSVGMGAALADASRAARDVFDEVDEALGQNLFRLMREGPDDELKLTANAQPAIMAHSIAVLRTMGVQITEVADFVAGHSLGEYSALCAAGSFDLATTARLLKLRGRAMQQAVPVGQGAMAALLGADLSLAQKIAEAAAQGEVCTVANDNDPSQVVISGAKAAIDRAIEIAKEMGAKRAVPLPVSAPFHCPLMMPAQERLSADLERIDFRDPSVPLVNNADAQPVRTAAACRDGLRRQVSAPVRWEESVQELVRQGVDTVVEVGPGQVLSGLVKKIDRGVRVLNVEDPASLEATVSALGARA